MQKTTPCLCCFSWSRRRLWELRLHIWRPQIPELKHQRIQIPGVQTKGLQIPGTDTTPGFGPRAGGQWVLKGLTHPNTSIRVIQAVLHISSHYVLCFIAILQEKCSVNKVWLITWSFSQVCGGISPAPPSRHTCWVTSATKRDTGGPTGGHRAPRDPQPITDVPSWGSSNTESRSSSCSNSFRVKVLHTPVYSPSQ